MTADLALVSVDALAAWLELARAIDDAGGHTPCERDPELWFSKGSQPERVEAALFGCEVCLVRTPCGRYGEAAGERWGIWGGRPPGTCRG